MFLLGHAANLFFVLADSFLQVRNPVLQHFHPHQGVLLILGELLIDRVKLGCFGVKRLFLGLVALPFQVLELSLEFRDARM